MRFFELMESLKNGKCKVLEFFVQKTVQTLYITE